MLTRHVRIFSPCGQNAEGALSFPSPVTVGRWGHNRRVAEIWQNGGCPLPHVSARLGLLLKLFLQFRGI